MTGCLLRGLQSWRQYLLFYLLNTPSKFYAAMSTTLAIFKLLGLANITSYFEHVLFTRERLLFTALPEAHLESHTGMYM